MGAPEIILIAVCALIVIGVAAASVIRKKQGKSSCDCGGDCSRCRGCAYSRNEKKK